MLVCTGKTVSRPTTVLQTSEDVHVAQIVKEQEKEKKREKERERGRERVSCPAWEKLS